MYLFDLRDKLKKLNPELEILTDKPVLGTVTSYPLVLRFGKRTHYIYGAHNHVDADTRRFMEMKENGQAGEFICGVSAYSPEWDRFQMTEGIATILMRGWHSLVMLLVNKKICTLERARRVFGSHVGSCDYSRWTYEDKLARFKKEVQDAQ